MNENAVVPTASTSVALMPEFTPEQVDLIRRQIAKDATPDELKLFLYQAKRTGLDPLAKQIYFQKRGGKAVFVTSIDGFRLTANRTGEHAGTDDAVFTHDGSSKPTIASVTVYRIVKGIRCAFTSSARWDEYYPRGGYTSMWDKMPHTMLAKCAEALALRKGFPAELSQLYAKEEMDQAGDEPVRASQYERPAPVVKPIHQEIPQDVRDQSPNFDDTNFNPQELEAELAVNSTRTNSVPPASNYFKDAEERGAGAGTSNPLRLKSATDAQKKMIWGKVLGELNLSNFDAKNWITTAANGKHSINWTQADIEMLIEKIDNAKAGTKL